MGGIRRPDYFTATIARMWCRMFMECYRMGVHDAADCDDEGLCRESIEYSSEPGHWSFISRRRSDNAIDIQLWLTAIGRDAHVYKNLMDYFHRMGRFGGSYMSVALTACQCFYNRGLMDFIETPDMGRLPRFDRQLRCFWTHNGLRKCDNDMIVDMAQELIGERQDTDMESGSKKAMRPVHYDMFRLCISKARRRYGNG